MTASRAWIWNLCGRDEAEVQRRLDAMGDKLHVARHSRADWRLAGYPRVVAPAPEGRGRSKGTRRQRRASR